MVQQLKLQLPQPSDAKKQPSLARGEVALKIVEEARDAAVKTYAGLSTAAVITAVISRDWEWSGCCSCTNSLRPTPSSIKVQQNSSAYEDYDGGISRIGTRSTHLPMH